MAESGNPEDLVSQVRVEGTEESTAKLDKFATEGAQAFDKLDKAAGKSAVDIEKATEKIEASADEALGALTRLGRFRLAIGAAAATDLKQVEFGAKKLVTVMQSATPAIASFVARLTALGVGSAAAGVAVLKAAQNISKGAATVESSFDKQTNAQVEANNSQLALTQGAIQYESAQRQLFNQLQRGQITNEQYTKSLAELRSSYQESITTARQMERAQDAVKEANERLTKQAADKKAFDALVDTWGGPMLTALRALGAQADIVFQRFQQTFGPAAAAGLDTITTALAKNGAAISAFFDNASKKLTDFISKNGPAIETAFQNIGAAISAVFDGVISAMPGLLAFFNNTLVPAVTAFGAILNTIATAINAIFGTQLTGGALVFLVILGQMTGSFIALIKVIQLLGAVISIVLGLPFGAVFLAIAAAIAVLLFVFPQLRQVALDVMNSIIATFQAVAAGATASVQRIIQLFTSLMTFFQGLPAQITGFFTTMWTGIVTGVTAVVAQIIAGFQSFIAFVATLPTLITQFFVDMGTAVVAAVNGWVTQVISFFQKLLAQAKAYLQPIIDMLNAIAALGGAGGGEGSPSVSAAGGGHIRGPGTATSDSIPAWLSNGEFVVKAKSVSKYGAGLLQAINSGRFKMPKFNMGGLVQSLMPSMTGPRVAYAEGGAVTGGGSMRPIALSIGEETFNMMAPEDVGERLTKFAVGRQNKSAGRKPAWVGRGRNN